MGLKLFDLIDEENIFLSSQVIFNNEISFEIPSNYYFNANKTNLENNTFVIINGSNSIKIILLKINNNEYAKYIDKLKISYKIRKKLKNYRNQEIVEFINNKEINILSYDGEYCLHLTSVCEFDSQKYFELYYIAYSITKVDNSNYNNLFYHNNNYCMLKNAFNVKKDFGIDLTECDPIVTLDKILSIEFSKYLCSTNNNIKYCNYISSLSNKFQIVTEKINNYLNKNNIEGLEKLADIIE